MKDYDETVYEVVKTDSDGSRTFRNKKTGDIIIEQKQEPVVYPLKTGEIRYANEHGQQVLAESFVLNEEGETITKTTIVEE